jgi:septum formation protein
VIGADTVVVLDGKVLGKPRDAADAVRMLQSLSGKTHQVMTGVCVLKGERVLTHTEVTEVTFRPLSDREIRNYVATKEPMDKAGAYGVQGGAARFVEGIRGDYFNVVGLPVCRLGLMLEKFMEETQ